MFKHFLWHFFLWFESGIGWFCRSLCKLLKLLSVRSNLILENLDLTHSPTITLQSFQWRVRIVSSVNFWIEMCWHNIFSLVTMFRQQNLNWHIYLMFLCVFFVSGTLWFPFSELIYWSLRFPGNEKLLISYVVFASSELCCFRIQLNQKQISVLVLYPIVNHLNIV